MKDIIELKLTDIEKINIREFIPYTESAIQKEIETAGNNEDAIKAGKDNLCFLENIADAIKTDTVTEDNLIHLIKLLEDYLHKTGDKTKEVLTNGTQWEKEKHNALLRDYNDNIGLLKNCLYNSNTQGE